MNTGVFKPKNHSSVWLFVTSKKAANQPKYVDLLTGKTLQWAGQASGKSDLMIIEHKARDLELLLFYRGEPKQYADSGFRYLGPVEYVSHNPGHPSIFTLHLTGIAPLIADSLCRDFYLPHQTGLRFSRKAPIPSCASSAIAFWLITSFV